MKGSGRAFRKSHMTSAFAKCGPPAPLGDTFVTALTRNPRVPRGLPCQNWAMARAGNDLEAQLDALYAAPLADFVEARNALSKNLGAAGRKDDAARVKSLAKPSAAAWAVNQVAFSSPRLLDALVAAGDRLRANPSDVKEAMRARREALNEAVKAAERAVSGAGRAASPDVSRRISATLEAIATYGSARGPVAGRLGVDVPAPGFDEVASLGLLGAVAPGARRTVSAPSMPVKTPRIEPPGTPSKKSLARERAVDEKRRRDARRALARRTKEARRARALLRDAQKAVEAIRRRRTSLEAALSGAVFEEKRLDAELAAARKAWEAADAAEREARSRSI